MAPRGVIFTPQSSERQTKHPLQYFLMLKHLRMKCRNGYKNEFVDSTFTNNFVMKTSFKMSKIITSIFPFLEKDY